MRLKKVGNREGENRTWQACREGEGPQERDCPEEEKHVEKRDRAANALHLGCLQGRFVSLRVIKAQRTETRKPIKNKGNDRHGHSLSQKIKVGVIGFEPTTLWSQTRTALIPNTDKQTTYDDKGEPLPQWLPQIRLLMQADEGLLDLADALNQLLSVRQRAALIKLLK